MEKSQKQKKYQHCLFCSPEVPVPEGKKQNNLFSVNNYSVLLEMCWFWQVKFRYDTPEYTFDVFPAVLDNVFGADREYNG